MGYPGAGGPPPKKNNGCLVAAVVGGVALILLVGALALLLVVVRTSGSDPGAVTAAPDAPTETDRGRQQADPAPMGTAVSPAAGWLVTVDSAELDGDDTVAEGSSLNTPVRGNRFVLAKITVRNDGDAPATFFDDVNLSVVGLGGTTGEPCKETFPGKLDQSVELAPGQSNSGFACFELPIDDIPGVVLRTEPVFSMDKDEDRRFLALG